MIGLHLHSDSLKQMQALIIATYDLTVALKLVPNEPTILADLESNKEVLNELESKAKK